jgi:hypothetical protein
MRISQHSPGGMEEEDDGNYNKKLWDELIATFLWYDTDRMENDASNKVLYCCLRIHCSRNVFT